MISVLNNKLMRAALAGPLLFGACATGAPADSTRPSIVAAFYPLAEAAEKIGGDRVDVTNLTPAGAEPHDLELSTDALDQVRDADLVLYLKGFQPALDEAVAEADGEVVDLLADLPVTEGDPHIWLDPTLWARAVTKARDSIVRVDPAGTSDHEQRGKTYIRKLADLGHAFETGLASCDRELLITAHGAFGYLTARYGLRQESIAGLSPEAEPDPKHLADLVDLVEDEDVTTIFTEELVSPDVAETLAREANVGTDVLDPIESEPRGGYASAMRKNLTKLRKALDCR